MFTSVYLLWERGQWKWGSHKDCEVWGGCVTRTRREQIIVRRDCGLLRDLAFQKVKRQSQGNSGRPQKGHGVDVAQWGYREGRWKGPLGTESRRWSGKETCEGIKHWQLEEVCTVGVSPASHSVAVGFGGKLSHICEPQLPNVYVKRDSKSTYHRSSLEMPAKLTHVSA